ncbi:MAG: hypothetical protein RMJ33_03195 [Saprospiraceae bacterium]|nr:hypothetical protein [Saprospiraceae bacterium]MDW8228823.1 hypothetical protein [Saprospiraceae bacterium]
MKKTYLKDRAALLERSKAQTVEYFTEERIRPLPETLKRYLRICGYLGTAVPFNADVYWTESWLRMAPKKDWTRLETLQFNSVHPIGRVAYMKFASMPVAARDLYRDGYGEVNGKLLNLFNVIFDNSKETAQSALITAFCEFMFIPGYLLLENVTWHPLHEHAVVGQLRDNGIEVSGVFHFDGSGLFTRFETDDRYYALGKKAYKKVKFSALVEGYKMQKGVQICEKVKIVWHLPEGDFEYYKGVIDRIEINVTQ